MLKSHAESPVGADVPVSMLSGTREQREEGER